MLGSPRAGENVVPSRIGYAVNQGIGGKRQGQVQLFRSAVVECSPRRKADQIVFMPAGLNTGSVLSGVGNRQVRRYRLDTTAARYARQVGGYRNVRDTAVPIRVGTGNRRRLIHT